MEWSRDNKCDDTEDDGDGDGGGIGMPTKFELALRIE